MHVFVRVPRRPSWCLLQYLTWAEGARPYPGRGVIGTGVRRQFRFRSFMAPPRAARSLLAAAYANPIVDGFARTSPRTRIISTLTSVEIMRRLHSRNTLWMIGKCSDEPTTLHLFPLLLGGYILIYICIGVGVLDSGRLRGACVRRR